jgi:O-antigen ligase
MAWPKEHPPTHFFEFRMTGLFSPTIWISILLGSAIGVLIAKEYWAYAAALASLAPLAILIPSRPVLGIAIWLLVMPFIYVIPGSNSVWWVIHRLLIPGLIIILLLVRRQKDKDAAKIKIGKPEFFMVLFLIYVPANIIFFQNYNYVPLREYYDRIFIPLCIYFFARLSCPDEKDLQILEWTVFFIAISQSLIGLLSWGAPQVLPVSWRFMEGQRTIGSFRDPAVYTSFLIFSIVLLFQGAMRRKPGQTRVVFLLTCGISAFCVFLSMERGSWLGGLLVGLGLFFLYPKPMLRYAFVGSIVIIILGFGIIANYLSTAGTRIGEKQQIYDRIVIADAMFQMIQLQPIFGWGYETLDQTSWKFYRQVGEAVMRRPRITSHNTYLTILTELGVIGFVLYLFPVVWLAVKSIKVWPKMPKTGVWNQKMLGVLWLAAIHQVVVSNFVDMRFFPTGLSLWWITLGLIAYVIYPHLGNHPHPNPQPIPFQIKQSQEQPGTDGEKNARGNQ